jgi:dual specificity phosphatase 12
VVFYRHLELFAACTHNPTINHPVVQAWLAEQSAGPPRQVTTKALKIASITNHPPTTTGASASKPHCGASSAFDLTAMNDALARYQPTSGSRH